MSKLKQVEKLKELADNIQEISDRLGNDPVNIPSIELDLMNREILTLYDTLQKVKALNVHSVSTHSEDRVPVTKKREDETSSSREAVEREASAVTSNLRKKAEKTAPQAAEEEEPVRTEKTKEAEDSEAIQKIEQEPVSESTENPPPPEPSDEPLPKSADNPSPSEPVKSPELLPSEQQAKAENKQKAENAAITPENTASSDSETSADEAEDIHEPEKVEEKPKQASEKQPPKSLNDRFYDEKKISNELGEKFKNKPISNLKSAISLNQKMLFIRHLFKGDEKRYKKAIEFMNKCGNYAEAKFFLEDEMKSRYDWDDKDKVYMELVNLVYRRFL